MRLCCIITECVHVVDELITQSQIMSGESLVGDRRFVRSYTFTENESTPLSYIRWADAPKVVSKCK